MWLLRMNARDISLERYQTIEPFLKRATTLEQISKLSKTPVRTLYNWVTAYEQFGLKGLQPRLRRDRGSHRLVQEDLLNVIQGLYLRTPPMPISAIHRRVREICNSNGWRVPGYHSVRNVILEIPSSLKVLAHEGVKAYNQTYGLVHRFEAERPNELWQSDHAQLDIKVLDSKNREVKPWLTVIIDDYSRAIAGYYLGLEPPSSMRIALALRQAIWRKEDSGWTICGIPDKFYSDRGSDFMSNHINQVAIDLCFEKIETEPGEPQGKGKCERFFLTVKENLLATLPGYSPEGQGQNRAILTLGQLDQRFKLWLLSEYLLRKHSDTNVAPKERWETFPFVPRMPDSIQQLDLLLLTLAKTRLVRRDGIRFSRLRYFDVALSGYVGKYVCIRYDPRDLSQIYVYSEDCLICCAKCLQLTGQNVSLKDVRKARNHEAKEQRKLLRELLATADKYAPNELPRYQTNESEPVNSEESRYPKFKIRRFACDKDD